MTTTDASGAAPPATAAFAPPDGAAMEAFRAALRGELLRPSDAGWDEARAVWNAAIDRRPALIVRCRGSADVREGIRFARERGLPLAVRGGGHNIAGSAVCDGGLVLDLSRMRSARVDPRRRVARVDPGCTLGDVDHETQAFGLAVPTGINSTTGIAGLTLGGGFGWLSRRHGLTVDNLVAVDVVTADGDLLHASEDEHAELFWGLRGGGGNFGVVTSFAFRLHALGPAVLAGLLVHPLERAGAVLRACRALAAALPDESAVWVVLRTAPPLPWLPAAWHGRRVVVLAAFHGGGIEEGERVLRPLRLVGHPVADTIAPRPYAAWQRVFDPVMGPGMRNYWKSHDLAALDDAVLDALVERAARAPTPQCAIFLGQVGGAVARVAPDRTAYAHRAAAFKLNVQARWDDPGADAACVAWAREAFEAVAPHATGGVYVNFLTGDEGERVRAAYGANWDRLVRLKERYDPANVFRANQNVRPREPGAAP